MNTLNYTFFEEYKLLENLCRDMYHTNTGVTSYIDDMMNTPWRNRCNIANWESDLIQLKRIRSLRNQLAHTEGTFMEDVCTEKDIQFVKDFYQRIIDGTDQLASKKQNYGNIQMTRTDVNNNRVFKRNQFNRRETTEKESYLIIAIRIIIIIVFIALMILLVH